MKRLLTMAAAFALAAGFAGPAPAQDYPTQSIKLVVPFGPGGGSREPGRPGPKVSPSEVKSYPDAGLYDANVLRTIFFDFEEQDWL
mgnify:CR=1 FL=1